MFRTIALRASSDDAKVKALRGELKRQVEGVSARVFRAAESLREQAQRLAQVVSQFRVR